MLLNGNIDDGYPCLVPNFWIKIFSISFTCDIGCGFLVGAPYIENITFYFRFSENFWNRY